MGYVSTWPNAKIIGKKSIYESESKSIELPELKVEKSVEDGANVPNVTEEASHTEGLSGEQTTTANSLMVESKPSENDQPLTKKEEEQEDVTVTLYLCFFYTHLSIFFAQSLFAHPLLLLYFLHSHLVYYSILFFFSIIHLLFSFSLSLFGELLDLLDLYMLLSFRSTTNTT